MEGRHYKDMSGAVENGVAASLARRRAKPLLQLIRVSP